MRLNQGQKQCPQHQQFIANQKSPGYRKATSQRTPAASVQAPPLTKQDLVEYFIQGCKPPEKWLIGTEHEKLGINFDDNTRINYHQIEKVFQRLQNRFKWQPIMEGEYVIGLKMDGQSVSLEPGGQFELSGAPLQTIHQTCQETNNHLYQVKQIAKELNMGFVGLGFDPISCFSEVPKMPKSRYKIMRDYMPKVGTLGHDMMFRSCTIQVNLDFETEQDMVQKLRVGLSLQPVATALFANSPFKEGKPTGYQSWRAHVWSDVDNNRCGNLPFAFDKGFGFEQYTDYAMDVPMYFVYRDGNYIDVTGQSFKDFMQGKLPGLPGEYPSITDWENHISTIFPEVRLKRFLEMRGADGGPWKMICALPALWVGLLYDSESLRKAADLTSDWTQEERDYLFKQVPVDGLKTEFRGKPFQDVALKVLGIAEEGLQRRGLDETQFLTQLWQIAERGSTMAEVLLDKYENEWGRSMQSVFDYEAF